VNVAKHACSCHYPTIVSWSNLKLWKGIYIYQSISESVKQYKREDGKQPHTGDNGNMESTVNKPAYNAIRYSKRKEHLRKKGIITSYQCRPWMQVRLTRRTVYSYSTALSSVSSARESFSPLSSGSMILFFRMNVYSTTIADIRNMKAVNPVAMLKETYPSTTMTQFFSSTLDPTDPGIWRNQQNIDVEGFRNIAPHAKPMKAVTGSMVQSKIR